MAGVTGVRVPPQWVPLAELAYWVRVVFDLEGDAALRRLILELRRGPNFRILWPEGPGIVQGGGWEKFPPEITSPDWETGVFIVGPRDVPGITPSRYRIKVRWEAVEIAVPRLWAQLRREGRLDIPAPVPQGPVKPPRLTLTPRQRLADTLTSLHGEGVDIHDPASVDNLHTRALAKAKIKASKATFESALADARFLNPIKFPHDGNDGS